MSAPWFSRLLLPFLLLVAGGCAPNVYTPATPPMPLHQRAGQAYLAVDAELRAPTRGFVSVSPLPHVTVYGGGLHSESLSGFYEGGLGTYTVLGGTNTPLVVEALAGWGRGRVDLTDAGDTFSPLYLFFPFFCLGPTGCPDDGTAITGTLTRQSVQLNLGLERELDDAPLSVTTGLALRLSRITMSDLDALDPLPPTDRALYLEPGLMARADVHGIGLQVSGGVSLPLSSFNHLEGNAAQPFHLGVGLYLRPQKLAALF
jgi:hypothetical protein